MNELFKNIEKIHTTELGFVRVRKNLTLTEDDVVSWCKETTKTADKINKKGKNWYVHKNNIVITVNASSYTIITAHKIKNVIDKESQK